MNSPAGAGVGLTDEFAARRAVLDHVLALVGTAPCGDALVLRGSMTMRSWVGDRAREPGDLDWVVRPRVPVPLDDLHPHPYVDCLDPVRLWPEAVHGVPRDEPWMFEDFDTGGLPARLPPEGLHWVEAAETAALPRPHEDVAELLRRHPSAGADVRVEPDGIVEEHTWGYSYDSGYRDVDGSGGGGSRLVVPWRAGDALAGTVRLDFAYDERLPEPPRLLAVPRRDGAGPPTVVWAATPELSLGWKLQWLCVDQAVEGLSAGKDLYDAVLLAELPGVRLSPRLLRTLLHRIPDPDLLRPSAVRGWTVDWSALPSGHPPAGTDPAPWLDRLAAALSAGLLG
ncbi:nucleotidyl transferase AbiEii/AbiGii toxin family protein [Micromonospora sp. WMMD1102]|uniref:nucleotidyl transferase AbiEii/AbiGii toxin family protein n=1 Tax=Micromonospora sp. WMMD1102 TaxID=3016105 RepID=UPI0024151EB6|nr:nucleotidyl transferase AbiEii/AbiGii toxin family protein [Micromonospora sp. WMMD1102]MDG4786643.1 nucleotidyl transferase AbiEii/AbiGii toxin family protein [Micromonospora sp. WMMD1102]